MIAKQIIGKDFYGLLAYNQKKVELGDAVVLDANIDLGSAVEMTDEFNVIRQLRPRLGKAVYHVSLNLPHGEELNDNQFVSMGEDYLKGMGFDDNQYIIYRHDDQSHRHIHIVANRIKFSGELVSDSKNYERSERLVRKLENKYALSQLPDPTIRRKSALTQKEVEKAIRTGNAPIKSILQQQLGAALKSSINTEEFLQQLRSKGIRPKFNISKTTGRVSGVSFKYEGVIYKGSSLGRQYSWNNIIKQIDYEQIRDRTVILENNHPEQGNKGAVNSDTGPSRNDVGKTKDAEGGAIQTGEKPKYDLGGAQKDGLMDEPFTPFKMELEDFDRWKRKKKKRKSRNI
ncbi:relaxase/mobilization nuclease domain-containing protein [Costertonia aggregata]|uniref:Relaxase/mobilization nuclease domain-containing protein n=1 Tax=Costertonia aggregata TaxID=343403 RepID=A0A7H9ATD8_9FLAO|nr:relaxase/mobilization nuclease domain-containing protein [Costertonia aggregata]QLG46612.1 relaxase/mobilization nuclease domain-containing protein [Costertonia aggregata]